MTDGVPCCPLADEAPAVDAYIEDQDPEVQPLLQGVREAKRLGRIVDRLPVACYPSVTPARHRLSAVFRYREVRGRRELAG
ncbi:MAG: hypothetical protein FWG23_02940 [Eggerthellaceae bacterium]|nr:hypothetical protein [Eggerthellaceae bacterium]